MFETYPPKREYTSVDWPHEDAARPLIDVLNERGYGGWEVCGVTDDGSWVRVFLKRPVWPPTVTTKPYP